MPSQYGREHARSLTSEFKQYCHGRNTAQQCRLGLFQDSNFAGGFEDSKLTSGGILCIFRSQTFVPMSWMCKKQTSVSQSSTDAEIISLDSGLRMDGIPALDLCNLVVEVFHCNQNQPSKTKDSSAQGNLWHRVMSSTRKKNPTEAPTKHDSSECFILTMCLRTSIFSVRCDVVRV